MIRTAMRRALAVAGLCAIALAASPVWADNAKWGDGEGCHKMLILRVIDGDTVYGYIDTSDPIVAIRAKLRLAGIDAPERGYRAQCPEEAAKADAARGYLNNVLSQAVAARTRSFARACNLKRGKYALRRLGQLEVRLENGWVDINALLLRKGYALPSKKRRKRGAWCRCLTQGSCPEGYSHSARESAELKE